MQVQLAQLDKSFEGLLFFDDTSIHQAQLMAYSTDASVYQEKPLAVAIPANTSDIIKLIQFATQNKTTLIPRAAGTSLAGQVVGNGVVVDISKYFTRVLEVNKEEKWVRVQPGVIRDDLNHYLKSYGLMFGPETSTANRAMIGGMLGNNSCGLHSIVWGSARDHVLGVKALLSDGSEAVFCKEDIRNNKEGISFKGKIYSALDVLLSEKHNQELIRNNFPASKIHRRNTGYALDSLLAMRPYTDNGEMFNLCKLLAGSEGTLAFVTEAKLNLIDLPPKETAVVCIHCHSIIEAMKANIVVLKHKPMASELVDKFIMDFTIGHPEYGKNRFFIEGDPAAILMVEFMDNDKEETFKKTQQLINSLKEEQLGFAYPVLYNEQTKSAWDIRKAGLGLLRNLKGDAQPVNLIEDCAVSTDDLPDYISGLQEILARHKVQASYYAHAGAGELHVEPIINLKSAEGLKTFRNILADTVALVKKYNGSLSGEHGDGRLRGEYIPAIVGEETYRLFKKIKNIFDPHNIFNAGKITDTPAMDTHLRVEQRPITRIINTTFDFSSSGGILRLAEKCSGSGDCRKMPISGGTMCPSYMATRMEKDTTRARANLLRQFLSNETDEQPFNHREIKEIMDLCLSCKGCKTECPSSVDIAKMKAEFLQQYYDRNGVPFRARLIAGFSKQMKLVSKFPGLFNWFYGVPVFRRTANRLTGFHPDRTMPKLANQTLVSWYRKHKYRREIENKENSNLSLKKRDTIFFFCDEFTNYNDVGIGKKAILLLEALGYQVIIPDHLESGRTYLSKGLVKRAAEIANQNIERLSPFVTLQAPLIGIEPSAILTFRDEYPELAMETNRSKAIELAKAAFTIEEFLAQQFKAGLIDRNLFTTESKNILIHGHCYQKALSSQQYISNCLEIPVNYKTSVIPSGCCGMAGGFGYEKEHYAISQQVGELVLYPAVKAAAENDIIAASGTSCRHQVKDGTGKIALHPVEILFDALIK
ncbi:MAG TPA: FAD-linked oxidase C-terminal domain-containing protein [Chitinophagaceae bacterium]|nr:FAD-linked oxidase C-terminal domain-containing protein [Chitinophagaceae bacterium]